MLKSELVIPPSMYCHHLRMQKKRKDRNKNKNLFTVTSENEKIKKKSGNMLKKSCIISRPQMLRITLMSNPKVNPKNPIYPNKISPKTMTKSKKRNRSPKNNKNPNEAVVTVPNAV